MNPGRSLNLSMPGRERASAAIPVRYARRPGPWRGSVMGIAAVCLGFFALTIGLMSAAAAAPRVALDCSGATRVDLAADLTTINLAATITASSQTGGYSCASWPENGGEFIYELNVTENLTLHAALNSIQDLDLFLLSACHSDSCLLASNREFLSPLTAGTYFLVVDSNQDGQPTFELDLTGWPAGIPQVACDLTKPLICTDTSASVTGNVYQQNSFVSYAECSTSVATGTERWHSLDLPDGASLRAVLQTEQADGVLWLFEGCGEAARCVHFADRASAGGEEELNFVNQTGTENTYYLVVDTFRPVASEEEGQFLLSVTCNGTSPPGHIPSEVAEVAQEIVCESGTSVRDDNLFNRPNLLMSGSCGALATPGGERWYGLILPDEATVTVTLDGMKFDGALWLFDGCGPDATCLAFADERYDWTNPLGWVELVIATKQFNSGHTYYLAVDTFEDTGSEYEAYWDYNLTIDCSAKSATGLRQEDGLQNLWR